MGAEQKLSKQKTRHFFLLSTSEKTEDMWELESDRGHIFQPFWNRFHRNSILCRRKIGGWILFMRNYLPTIVVTPKY